MNIFREISTFAPLETKTVQEKGFKAVTLTLSEYTLDAKKQMISNWITKRDADFEINILYLL